MSNTFYRRLTLIFGFLALGAIFAMQAFVANIEIKDLDLWLHIGTGRYIVNHGFHVPGVDFLSCSIAGKPWVNHEWLFQVIVYLIYQLQGPAGLLLMQVVVISITGLILIILTYNRKRQFLCILSFLFLSLVYQSRFTIRPDLFSLLFFSVYILILSFFLEKRWSSAVLFVTQVLWSNMHGFFFFGPLFILIALIGEWLKRHVPLPWNWNKSGRVTGEEYRRLKWLLGFTIFACLLNPLTFKGAWYPIGVFFQLSGDSSIFFDYIMELSKPIDLQTIWRLEYYSYFKIMIMTSFLSFFFNRRNIDIGVFLFWLVFLGFSLMATRNVVYFAFAAHLAFMANISNLSLTDVVPIKIRDKKFIYSLTLVLKVMLLVWVMQYIINFSGNGYFDFDRYEHKSEFGGVSQRNFPNKAVDFLVDNNVKGNMYNEFNSGAYVVGRCHPDIKVYIDGRTEVYGPDFFKRYLNITRHGDSDILQEEIKKYDMSIALLNSVKGKITKEILKFFYEAPDWKLVYLDYDGIVFLKDIERYHKIIAEHEIDLHDWKVKELDEYRVGSKKILPYHHIHRAYSLKAMGFLDAAADEARAALKIFPNYSAAFDILGQVHAEREQYKQGFHYFRLALNYNSSDKRLRTNLAKMYELLGMYNEALRQYDIVMRNFGESPDVAFLMARTYIRSGDIKKARKYALMAFKSDQNAARDIIELGDLLIEKQRYADAIDIYAIALKGPNRLREIRLKIGDAFKEIEQWGRAKEEWQAALELATDDEQKQEAVTRLETVSGIEH